MASRRNQRRKRERPSPIWSSSCQTKKRFDAEHHARLAGQDSIRRPGSDIARLWVYECVGCRGWHLTRQTGQGKPITADDLG
jgi:hypothetical protein